MWNITTKINFSQPGGVNVILQTVRQIDATQNKAVPDDPYARLFKAAPSCSTLERDKKTELTKFLTTLDGELINKSFRMDVEQ